MSVLRFIHDTETTGLDAEKYEIVEIASIAMTNDGIVGEFSSLVNCGLDHLKLICKDDWEKLPYNNIPVAEVLGARPKDIVSAEHKKWMAGMVSQYPGDISHHAYNNGFDSRFLRQEPWNIYSELWGECLMLLCTRLMDKFKWQKLIDSAAHWGVSFTGEAHRAQVDARCAAEIYQKIIRARVENNV